MKPIRVLSLTLALCFVLSAVSSCTFRFGGGDTTTPPATTTAGATAAVPGADNRITPYVTSSEIGENGERRVSIAFYLEGEVHMAGFLMTLTLPDGVTAEADGRTMTSAHVSGNTVTALMASPTPLRSRCNVLNLTLTYRAEGAITIAQTIEESFTVLDDGEIVPVKISYTSILIP